MNAKKNYNPYEVIQLFSKIMTDNSKKIPKNYVQISSPYEDKFYLINSVEGLLSIAIYSGIYDEKPKYIVNPITKRKVLLDRENGKIILDKYLNILKDILAKNVQLGGAKFRALKKMMSRKKRNNSSNDGDEGDKEESFQLKPILGYGASSMLGLGVEAVLQAGKFLIGLIPAPIKKIPGEIKEAALNNTVNGKRCSPKPARSISLGLIQGNKLGVNNTRIISLVKKIKEYNECPV